MPEMAALTVLFQHNPQDIRIIDLHHSNQMDFAKLSILPLLVNAVLSVAFIFLIPPVDVAMHCKFPCCNEDCVLSAFGRISSFLAYLVVGPHNKLQRRFNTIKQQRSASSTYTRCTKEKQITETLVQYYSNYLSPCQRSSFEHAGLTCYTLLSP